MLANLGFDYTLIAVSCVNLLLSRISFSANFLAFFLTFFFFPFCFNDVYIIVCPSGGIFFPSIFVLNYSIWWFVCLFGLVFVELIEFIMFIPCRTGFGFRV